MAPWVEVEMTRSRKIRSLFAVGAASLAIAGGFAGTAAAQESPLSQITGCDVPGGKQTTGALLGATLGALAGNSLSKGDHAAGTVLGALVGGAAGSWMGCKVQRDEAQARYTGYAEARQDLVRHPVAYRRALAEERFRARQEAEYRAWRSRQAEQSRYADGYGYGDYGY
jgi:phage tail tape-measure protein